MNEAYEEFLPEVAIDGKRGFYPSMTAEEYRAIPLPMKCGTWDASVQYVIFDTFFADYGLSFPAQRFGYAVIQCLRCATSRREAGCREVVTRHSFRRISDCDTYGESAGNARRFSRAYSRKLQKERFRRMGAFPARKDAGRQDHSHGVLVRKGASI